MPAIKANKLRAVSPVHGGFQAARFPRDKQDAKFSYSCETMAGDGVGNLNFCTPPGGQRHTEEWVVKKVTMRSDALSEGGLPSDRADAYASALRTEPLHCCPPILHRSVNERRAYCGGCHEQS